MGLDNGIIIEPKTKKGMDYLARFDYLKEDNGYEYGYWRKCWNIRQKFIDDFNYNRKKCKIVFKIKDIPAIINTLEYFLDKEHWEYNGRTSLIFNWYEEVASIANAIKNLYLFYDDIDESADNEDDVTDKDFHIYFYDSY
jgi:hypothetical protein